MLSACARVCVGKKEDREKEGKTEKKGKKERDEVQDSKALYLYV